VERWELRVRQILLAAHVLPAVFGLIAVIVSDSRRLDVVVWSVVLAWTLVLLALGWRRSARAKYLIAWIFADATVMAALMFFGTSARQVVSLVAVDGALFAAVFVSAPVALAQVAVAYSGLIAAETLRAQGSDLPTAGVGWQTPVVVTLAGILALRFLRSALDRLGVALVGRHETLAVERVVLAEAAREESIARDAARLERDLAPSLARLERLSVDYAAVADGHSAHVEAQWLVDSSALARRELASLQTVLEPADDEELGDLVDTAILASSAAQPGRPAVTRQIPDELVAHVLPGTQARAVAGFVREAVNNALVHGAPPVLVSVAREADNFRVRVSDEGMGFDGGAAVRGLGLEAIEELASSIGARIGWTIDPDGGGHVVEMSLPGAAL
jgi:two-component sensor histidine kinase